MKHAETQPFLKSADGCRCKHVQYIFPFFSSIFRMHNTSIWSVVNLLHRKPHRWSSKIFTASKQLTLTAGCRTIKNVFTDDMFVTNKLTALQHHCLLHPLNLSVTFQRIYNNIKQLDALNFIMNLFHASTCFEHMCSSSGGQNCTIQPVVSSQL